MSRAYRKLKVFTDGASRNNPGPAAVGVFIQDEQGDTVAAHSRYLGIATNNVAEYTALLDALELLARYPAETVEIYLDSQLVVRQIHGQYRIRQAHLLPLAKAVREKLDRLGKVTLSHIPREQNREADRLANEAIDKQSKKS